MTDHSCNRRLGFGLQLFRGLKHGGLGFNSLFRRRRGNRGNDDDLCHHCRFRLGRGQINRFRHWLRRRGSRSQLGRVTSNQHALLANFNLNGARLAAGIGRLDLGGLLARQGNLGLGFRLAMGLAQVLKQLGFILFGQCIVGGLLSHASLMQLLKQSGCGHFQLAGKL